MTSNSEAFGTVSSWFDGEYNVCMHVCMYVHMYAHTYVHDLCMYGTYLGERICISWTTLERLQRSP